MRAGHRLTPVKQRVSDLIAAETSRSFVGRDREIGLLLEALKGSGPRVIFLHGIAGIGKSRLLAAFVERARRRGARAIMLDCRSVEPTERGFLQWLGSALRRKISSTGQAAKALASRNARVLLVLDHYEVWRLLDSWLRQTFIPKLPGGVRVILASREPPAPPWSSSPGWRGLLRTIELDALAQSDATKLLAHSGIRQAQAVRINRIVRGHPLALTLAAGTFANQSDRILESSAIQRVIAELAQLYLADIADPLTQQALEASCVVRRATVPLLRAMIPEANCRRVFEALRALPFVHVEADGLHVHDSVKQTVAATLRGSDPARYHAHRRAAWAELRGQLARVPNDELWRYTADMLFLLDNPVVREAFFPSESALYSVEVARPGDGVAIRSICAKQERRESGAYLCKLWEALPQAFSTVHDHEGKVVGFYCLFEAGGVSRKVLNGDPLVKGWLAHLRRDGVPKGQRVLFLRRWLSESTGEAPSAVQAACWLDIKRTYLAMRPKLRRVYLTVTDLGAYASVAQTLGFRPLESAACQLDGRTYHTAMLDFGASSIDGWLARLVAAELQVKAEDVIDIEGRSLVVEGKSVPLTRLEFGVIRYLHERKGKPVARASLIQDVWNHEYDVGSNVVDVLIKSLRKKLGAHSDMVETVSGYGYRLRLES
ncbi:MAG: winged helix-turn-helix domain-containing protein [Candidatus Acidiferrales bacterium]